ncbi:chromatin protein Cren7 [Desulfurococcus amylolyticus]|uniref:chromatin protein Cren7 n=1 Tax=Desulfurococcus amylolyticus TaxID=94694 RepID=UPI0023EF7D22|nr:chromatin protein Cren7 [Desulfurococcus amylolyticus]
MSKQPQLKCPKCGSNEVDVERTWQLASPLPDTQGRITITIMGVVKCRRCGYKWRGVVSKLKVGGGKVEIEGEKMGKVIEGGEEPRPPKEIILDIDDIMNEE